METYRTYRLERKVKPKKDEDGKVVFKGLLRVEMGNWCQEFKPDKHVYKGVPEILATRASVKREFDVSLESEESKVKAKPKSDPRVEPKESRG